MRDNSFASPARHGLTLIEIVAGIALLATLLVSTLAAFRAHAAQVRTAKDRLAAIQIADELLAAWMNAGTLPSIGESEHLPDTKGWKWRIARPEPTRELRRLGALAVRFEILDSAEPNPTVLTAVELLVPAGGGP